MYNNKTIFAFIPAKTNSVGLPNKMFLRIGEFTLFEWTLLAAIKSRFIDEIVVSSHDDRIEDAITKFESKMHILFESTNKKIQYVRRPKELCDSMSKTEETISQFFQERFIYRSFDYMVMLQATSPARRNNLIDYCIENCVDKHDSLITVEKQTPFFWRKNTETQTVYPMYSLKNRPMRQQLTADDFFYKDNGNVYITKVQSYLANKIRVSGDVFLHETEKFESLQIDDSDDFAIMSKLYEYYGNFL